MSTFEKLTVGICEIPRTSVTCANFGFLGMFWKDIFENADMVDKPNHLIGDACRL